MKSFRIVFPLFLVFLLLACAATPDKSNNEPAKLFAAGGTVLELSLIHISEPTRPY